MRLSVPIAALFVIAACHAKSTEQSAANQAATTAPGSAIKGVHREARGRPGPDSTFNDPEGRSVRIGDFRGRPLLVNLWASWCAPCVKELPTLDQLSRSQRIQVLAVSQDTGPHTSVTAFLKSHQISALEPYQDPNMALSGALGPDTVLPTSILFDSKGREVWRYVGDLDWTSPEASRLLAEAAAAPRRG